MQDKINEIQKIAGKLKELDNNNDHLFKRINELDEQTIDQLHREFAAVKYNFKPVNLLRFMVLEYLKNGEEIDEQLVESLKDKIRNKATEHFAHLGNELIEGLKNYPVKSKDIFTNWQNPFRIFYSFFYFGNTKEKVLNYLEEITQDITSQLNVEGLEQHIVDFKGPQNFGATYCWIAVFPKEKISHQKAYQFFIQIGANNLEAGMMPGSDLKGKKKEKDISVVETYEEALEKLKTLKDTIINKNKKLKNYWKYLIPGDDTNYWDEMYQNGIMAIEWDELGDISNKTIDDLNNSGNPEIQNAINNWNIIQNFRDASIGDVVIAEKDMVNVYGIGVIKGKYYFDENRDYFKHVRQVEWVINKHIDFSEPMFGPDTFSRTKKWKEIKTRYSKLDTKYSKILKEIEQGKLPKKPNGEGPAENDKQNFWWLNANPNIWSIDNFDYNELQDYTTHNEKGNKRRIYKYFTEVVPGDLVIGYESSPSRQIKAIFKIKESVHKDNNGEEKITFKLVEKVADPILWDDLKDNPELKECEVIINNQGSLFKLNSNEFNIIRDLIDEKNILIEQEKKAVKIEPYTYQSDPDKPYIDYEEVRNFETALKLKKNIVLQGPPGTGKTFIAKKIAYDIMGKKDNSKIEMIQFHQSYSYEDFIQGIRPAGNEFRVKNGIFYNFCKKAERDKENDYFFIIDEINRGNLSKIFGELMMLIESDKRGDQYSIPLTYSENQGERFSVPENVHIIGTMNTADRSLAIVDYALRRRFDFITIYPQFNDAFKNYLVSKDISEGKAGRVIELFRDLNQRITKDKNLGKGFRIGHSYFCNDQINGSNFDQRYKHIIEYEIVPLLEEYWFDNMEKVQSERYHLLRI